MRRAEAPIGSVRARAYTIPTDEPEQDGTLDWDSTTLIVATVEAGGYEGIGYTYAGKGNAGLIGGKLAKALKGQDAFDIPGCVAIMEREVRNMGRRGLAGTAISAVDVALWDLKAKQLDLPLVRLLGAARPHVPIYGSGGFTNYTDARLAAQLGGWVAEDGCRWVKMKSRPRPAARPAAGEGGARGDRRRGAVRRRQRRLRGEAGARLRRPCAAT
jgi:L-alanine-DL-glutamate epimerase-like enolase superfamily enzyme